MQSPQLPPLLEVVQKPTSKGFRRPILEILEDLQRPIPQRFIKTKSLKGNKISYVPWCTLVRLLDFYTPGWDWEVTTQYHGSRTVVEGKLTIKAAEGDFIRCATGIEFSDVDNYGDPTSNAEAMALRRCCAKYGLGLSLWEKD